MGVFFSEYKKT